MLRTYAILALLHGYIAWRLLPDLPYPWVALALATWLVLSLLLMPLGFAARRFRDPDAGDRATWAGMLAAGAFSSLLLLTLLRDIVLTAAHLAPASWLDPALMLRSHATTALGVPLLAALATMAGLVNARLRAAIRRVDVPITNLPASLHGFTIAQISDVHVGPTIKRRYLDAIVDAVNALNADLIAVTGDLVDGSVERLSHHTQQLSRLAARHGAYFVTGNHEYYSGARAWITELRRLGLRVLQNEHVVLEHDGETLVVGGVTDYGAHHFDPAQRSDPKAAIAGAPRHAAFRLLLAHQPRSAFAAMPAGFDLQLSGHTHGGQFVPWNFLVRLQQPFTAGLHRLGSLWVYISRGTGYWGPPIRLGAPSEITAVRLVAA